GSSFCISIMVVGVGFLGVCGVEGRSSGDLKSASGRKVERMGRGVSSGGGQSSLGYLFGGPEAPKSGDPPKPNQPSENPAPVQKPASPAPAGNSRQVPGGNSRQVPAGIQGSNVNNYFRADGQNCGNFITERPSTKVHAAPGGGSSLDFLFGGDSKNGK
ncbi:hypothetical protein Taro_021037, partial [Colocasia esculenta]|nr:hypothetical protein [Colocasia esculenta]